MNELYLSLTEDLVRNASFYNKHFKFFSTAVKRIKFVNDLYETNFASQLPTRKHFFQEEDHDYSEPLSPRAFRGLESDAYFQKKYGRMLKIGKEELVIHEQKYIGVGYKDKGARRDPAKDGSPAWQEVAMTRKNMTKNSDWEKLLRESEIDQLDEQIDESNSDTELENQIPPRNVGKILEFVNEANAPLLELRKLSYGPVAANDDLYIAELD